MNGEGNQTYRYAITNGGEHEKRHTTSPPMANVVPRNSSAACGAEKITNNPPIVRKQARRTYDVKRLFLSSTRLTGSGNRRVKDSYVAAL